MKISITTLLTCLALCGAFVTTGCEDGGGAKPDASAAPAAEADPATMTDEQIDAVEIPTEDDFEEEAAQAITPDTLDDELAKIEDELDG